MKEKWIERISHETCSRIRIDGDDATVEGLRSVTIDGPKWDTYVVVLVAVRTTWIDGSSEGKQQISLMLRKLDWPRDWAASRHTTEFLREIPTWLYDLITRASPRDIEVPDAKPSSWGIK